MPGTLTFEEAYGVVPSPIKPDSLLPSEERAKFITFDEAIGGEAPPSSADKAQVKGFFSKRLDDFKESLQGAVGVVETVTQMVSGFPGFVAGIMGGLDKAIFEGGGVEQYEEELQKAAETFDFMTFEPRTEKGKFVSETVNELFGKYRDFVQENVVENIDSKTGKVFAKAAGDLAPLAVSPALKGIRNLISPKRKATAPVDEPIPVEEPRPEAPPDATIELKQEAPVIQEQPKPQGILERLKAEREAERLEAEKGEKVIPEKGETITVEQAYAEPIGPKQLALEIQKPKLKTGGEPIISGATRFEDIIYVQFDDVAKAPTPEALTELIRKEVPGARTEVIGFGKTPISGFRGETKFRIDVSDIQGRSSIESAKQVMEKVFGGEIRSQTTKIREGFRGAGKTEFGKSELRPSIQPSQVKIQKRGVNPQTQSMHQAIAHLGGIDRVEVERLFGLKLEDFSNNNKVVGKPILRKNNGLSIDRMMDALAEEGFLARDKNGKVDPREFEEKFFDEEAGNKQFSQFKDQEISKDFEGEAETFFRQREADETFALGSEAGKPQEGGTAFYSGVPIEEIGKAVRQAEEGLKDGLGIPEKGIEITLPEIAKRPGFIDTIKSPTFLAKKFPQIKKYVEAGVRSIRVQDTLRDVFNRRLKHVDGLLRKGKESRKVNKTLLNEILLEGDFLGKDFTRAELRVREVPDNVISAYSSIRSAYNHALGIANKTRALKGKEPVNKRTGYIPHFFHNFFIKEVLPSGKTAIIDTARGLREAISLANKMKREGRQVSIAAKEFRFPGEENQAAVIGDMEFFKMKGKLEKEFSFAPEEAQALMDNIVSMKGRSRFVGNFMERKGVKGWEKNLDFVHRHYFNMISRFAAMDRFKTQTIRDFERQFGRFDKDHSGVAKYVKDYINDINGVPTNIESIMNSTLANNPAFSKFLGRYLGERPALQLAGNMTSAMAIGKLGLLNVSAALVNLTQFNNIQAAIGPRWAVDGARRAGILAKGKGIKLISGKLPRNPDLAILRQLGIGLQQGLEAGAGFSKFNASQLLNKTTVFFQGAEWFNRATAGLGAYHKAISEGKNHSSALEIAANVNQKTNFDYSIADAPQFIRRSGPPGQVMFQFKKFPIKQFEFMTELKGMEQARFWIPFVTMAGIYGLPGMEAINEMVKGLFELDIELETKDALMRWAGDDKAKQTLVKSIMFGAFSNEELGGVDISRRVGAGDFIPSEFKDVFPGVFGSSILRGYRAFQEGDWVEFVRSFATSPGNILKAAQGETQTSMFQRGRATVKLTPGERVKKALGLRTTKEAISSTVNRVISNTERKLRLKEQKAIDNYLKAVKTGDLEKIEKAFKALEEFGITGQRILNEAVNKQLPSSLRKFRSLSNKAKVRQAPLIRFQQSATKSQ